MMPALPGLSGKMEIKLESKMGYPSFMGEGGRGGSMNSSPDISLLFKKKDGIAQNSGPIPPPVPPFFTDKTNLDPKK